MTDDHSIHEYGEELPAHVRDLGDEPVVTPTDPPDPNDVLGDANTDMQVSRSLAPSDDSLTVDDEPETTAVPPEGSSG